MPVIEKPNPVRPVNYDQVSARVTCPDCKGTGERKIGGGIVTCQTCAGTGAISDIVASQLLRMSAS